ncbi:unnamed protein product [Gemmataceae bacterium]|nr:unnamed protein product [Gemmataceae bacterium]VTU02813.1 unnamed protein product [Gemmataceae bacterium]
MTEAEWLACNDPKPMLAFLRGRATDRKLRLFSVAIGKLLAHGGASKMRKLPST